MMGEKSLSRRHALRAAGAAAALVPIGAMAPLRPAAAGPAKKLKLAWNANAICTMGVPAPTSAASSPGTGWRWNWSTSAAARTSC